MKHLYFSCFFFVISCLFFISCSDEISYKTTIRNQQKSNKTIKSLIQYAQIQYNQQPTVKSLYSNESDSNPMWSNFKIHKKEQDTLSISIPIYINLNERRAILIANQIKTKKELFLITSPNTTYNTLPINIRRRVIVNINGKEIVYRTILNMNKQPTLVRIRNLSRTKSVPINGGILPEVIVYPSGLDYNIDWWWWDYISGVNSITPPNGYTGYNPNNDSNKRADYYKSENIIKDVNVQKAFKSLIKNTKTDASKANGRRERGFWVYYDQKTNKYYTGTEKHGEYVNGIGTNGSVSPGNPLPSNNGLDLPKTAIPVTFVHTHTPLTYENNCQRQVGFSPSDINYANENNIEIIVIDYVGIEDDDGKYYIQGGHNIDDPTKEYIYIPNT